MEAPNHPDPGRGDVSCFRGQPRHEAMRVMLHSLALRLVAHPNALLLVTRMSLLFSKIPGARNQKRYLQNLDLDIDCIDVS